MRILVVDDERDIRSLIVDLLTQAGHSVTMTSSAVGALAHLRMQPFDAAVLDIMMPGIDGLQLAQSMSTNWETFEIPIIMVSCRTDAEARSWAKMNGCVRYLPKPFSPAELLDAVGEIERGDISQATLPSA